MNARLVAIVRAIVGELVAPHAYHALVRYRAVKNTAGRIELQVVRRGRGFPDALPLSMQPGAPGAAGTPQLGSVVLVAFIEGDPQLPVVTHFARPEDSAFVPVASSLDASGTVRIGEHADLVHLGSGDEIDPLVLAAPVGRVLRYGDTIGIPGVGDVLLAAGSIPKPCSRVKA